MPLTGLSYAMLCCAVPRRNVALKGMTHDIHADVQEDPKVIAMAESAERFDPRTEEVFKVLQVISACAMMFTHGANGESRSLATGLRSLVQLAAFCPSLQLGTHYQSVLR